MRGHLPGAWLLVATALPLFVAGGPHDPSYERFLKKRIAELELTGRVMFLGYVDRDSMAGGMAHARVFIFSSLLEACPNTLLEALGCGAAIVASDVEPNREVAQAAVEWCEGRNAVSMADAIVRTAGDDRHRSVLRHRGLAQAEYYSWGRTAERLVRVLEQVHRGQHRPQTWATPEELPERVKETVR